MSDRGWICPKCEAVYAPFVPNCMSCTGKAKAPAEATWAPRTETPDEDDRPRRNDPLRGYGGRFSAKGPEVTR